MSFKVESIFEIADKATRPMRDMERGSVGLASNVDKAKSSIVGMAAKVGGLIAGSFGMFQLAKGFLATANAAEALRDEVAAAWLVTGKLTNPDPYKRLADSIRLGEKAMEGIWEMSTKGVASIQTYSNVFQRLALPAIQKAGVSQERLLNFTKQLAVVVGPAGVGGAAEAFSQTLAGTALLAPRKLLFALGVTQEAWKKVQKQGPEAMFAFIEQKMATVAPVMRGLYENWPDQLQRAANQARMIAMQIGVPMLTQASVEMQKLLGWYNSHRAEVDKIAKIWSERVVGGVKVVAGLISTVAQNWELFAAAFIGPRLIGGLTALTGQLALLGSARVTGIGSIRGFVSKLGGAAMALGVFAIAAQKVADAIGESYVSDLQKAADRRVELHKEAIAARGKQEQMNELVRLLHIADRTKQMPSGAPQHLQAMWEKFGSRIGQRAAAGGIITYSTIAKEALKYGAWRAEQESAYRGATAGLAKPTTEDKSKRKFDFSGSTFEITQEFAPGFDPDRIAVSFAQDLADMGETSVTSGWAPTFAVA